MEHGIEWREVVEVIRTSLFYDTSFTTVVANNLGTIVLVVIAGTAGFAGYINLTFTCFMTKCVAFTASALVAFVVNGYEVGSNVHI